MTFLDGDEETKVPTTSVVIDNSIVSGNIPSFVFWMFGILTAVSLFRSLVHIFKHDGGAQSIASIPLDNYPKPGKTTITLPAGVIYK